MIALLCCVCYDEKQANTLLFYYYTAIHVTHFQSIKGLIYHLKPFSYTYKQNRKDRLMSDKEDVIQILVVLQLTKDRF